MSKREFKVGDKVNTPKGEGEIVFIDTDDMLLVDLGEGYDGHDGLSAYYKHPTETCLWMHGSELELIGNETPELELIGNETPEPLENWKHPYYGKPILVKNRENEEWKEKIFDAYVPSSDYPIRTSGAVIWQFYKFPGPSIKLTVEELLTIAENLKGLKVELKEGE